jgi:O-acetyl-ADP-ribose deacetylase (regulator of RNase III)
MRPGVHANSAQIDIRQEDILAYDGDGLLLPTLSPGTMIEGLAIRVKEIVGQLVEDAVAKHAPIAVGAAMLSEAPSMPVRHLIHAPVAESPGEKSRIENVRRATRAGLLAANHYELERIAIPGIGYGESGIPHDEAARAIIDEIRGFKGGFPKQISLIDEDIDMVDAFEMLLAGK